MILPGVHSAAEGGSTLDQLFRRAAIRAPDRLALIDPPNRLKFADGAPRQLTFAQADLAIWRMAAHLRALGLQTDTVIALQLPNIVENVVALLGVLRSGMIPALIPQLWRRMDATPALAAIGAKAIVTTTRLGAHRLDEEALRSAADLFQIRHVMAFGESPADGVSPLDDIFSGAGAPSFLASDRSGDPAAHAALITFDTTADGIIPVARDHHQVVAGGDAVLHAAGLQSGATLLSTLALSSFSVLSATLTPWLLCGGALVLHQPFDANTFVQQQKDHPHALIVTAGALAERIPDETAVVALWHAEEQARSAASPSILDVISFGETGFMTLPRERTARPRKLPRGPQSAAASEASRASNGFLTLRGAMVPTATFPITATPGVAALQIADDGAIDTRYPCRIDADHLVVTGAQAGLVRIGGCRFPRHVLDRLPIASGTGGVVVAVPHALLSQRLAGSSRHLAPTQNKLAADGYHALIVQAFRPRVHNAAVAAP
ncbi:MAG: acyl--CoA ligase [Pseudolabrys sp.]|nr:acyl--CoA ligase [Pseudolabrys sp.]